MKHTINMIIEVTQNMLHEYLFHKKKADLRRYAVELKRLCEKILEGELK
jgi:hypothetical protein